MMALVGGAVLAALGWLMRTLVATSPGLRAVSTGAGHAYLLGLLGAPPFVGATIAFVMKISLG